MLSDANVPVRFRAQQRVKYSSLQLTATCIAAKRCLRYYDTILNSFENHRPQRTQISTVTNAQESNPEHIGGRRAFSLLRHPCSPFTQEIEENGKLPYLDCLVSRDSNELQTTVYNKLTHTDRLLDESSYNPTSHKATTIKALTRRAQLVCDTPDSLRDENRYLKRVFHQNNYNADFIRRNIYRPTEVSGFPWISSVIIIKRLMPD